MRRLAALCPDEVITADVIAAELTDPVPAPGPASAATPGNGPETLSSAVERHIKDFLAAHNDGLGVTDVYDKIIAEVERPLIRLTLAATRGNQIKAASMLGLNRNTLRKKIRDLEIPVVRGLM
jgi:two-component system nitrogen regulation response regulator GlnG